MKHGKRPTRKQKEFLKSIRLNIGNWLVSRDNETEMVIVHRYTGHTRTFKKQVS